MVSWLRANGKILFRGAALLLAGAAAGFGLGLFFAVPAGPGCQESDLTPLLSMSYAPEPDLFIRTGGEERISNFLLWQLAYAEFYFTETLWPEFDSAAFELALRSYRKRERRFGRTSEQLVERQASASASPD